MVICCALLAFVIVYLRKKIEVRSHVPEIRWDKIQKVGHMTLTIPCG